LRMAIKTHSLETLSIVGRSTAAYFVNGFFLMLWGKYRGESLNNP